MTRPHALRVMPRFLFYIPMYPAVLVIMDYTQIFLTSREVFDKGIPYHPIFLLLPWNY